MNLPNLLTIFRFILILLFVYAFYGPMEGNNLIWATIVFITAGITDFLDGFIARRYHMVTRWGKLMDPLADKLMLITVLICLYDTGLIPLEIIIVVALKEILMIGGAAFLYKNRNQVIAANYYGKAATVIFYVAIVALIMNIPYAMFILIAAVLVTLFALFQYGYKGLKSHKVS